MQTPTLALEPIRWRGVPRSRCEREEPGLPIGLAELLRIGESEDAQAHALWPDERAGQQMTALGQTLLGQPRSMDMSEWFPVLRTHRRRGMAQHSWPLVAELGGEGHGVFGIGPIGRVDIVDPTELAVKELHHQPGDVECLQEDGHGVEEVITCDEIDKMLCMTSRHRDDSRTQSGPGMDDDVTRIAEAEARNIAWTGGLVWVRIVGHGWSSTLLTASAIWRASCWSSSASSNTRAPVMRSSMLAIDSAARGFLPLTLTGTPIAQDP